MRNIKIGFLAAAAWSPMMAYAQAASAEDQPTGNDIVVTGSIYRGEIATSGARIDVPTKDLPLSISVVTKALIEDRQVRNIRDLSENVAGVRSRSSGSGAFTIDFTIRGLQGIGGSVIAVNGFRVDSFSAGFDPQAVERVEFLKGPASVLYGASGSLSGLVNVVTKTPQQDNFLVADMTLGTPTYGRATLDGNFQISDTLESRTNLALTEDTQLNAFRGISEHFAMQSFRWHLGNFSIIAEGSYFHAVGPSREATAYPMLDRFFDLPKRFKVGEAWDRNINTGYLARVDASWQVTPNLTLRQGINYQNYHEVDHDVASYDANTYVALIGPDLLARSLRRGDARTKYWVSQSEVRWNFQLGPTTHKVLAGFEYGDFRGGGLCCSGAELAPLDLNNPVHGAIEPEVALVDYFNNTIRTKAFYIQDYVTLGQFRLLAGLRRDNTRSTTGYCSFNDAGCPDDPVVANLGVAKKKAFSPRLGIAWQPSDYTTAFLSWSKSFNPNTSLDRNNNILPPEHGVQYELGIRQDLLAPGVLTVTASVFNLERQNIADCDPTIPDCSRSVAIGEQRVRGAELEFAGKPVEWLDVIGTYAYLNAKVTKSDVVTSGIPVGSKLPEAVPHSASLFAKAALSPLGLPDVSLSAGVYYVDKRPGRDYFSGPFQTSEFANVVRQLPASTRVDIGAYWDVSDHFRLQGNITNLFDVKMYEPVNAGFNRAQPFRAAIGGRVTL